MPCGILGTLFLHVSRLLAKVVGKFLILFWFLLLRRPFSSTLSFLSFLIFVRFCKPFSPDCFVSTPSFAGGTRIGIQLRFHKPFFVECSWPVSLPLTANLALGGHSRKVCVHFGSGCMFCSLFMPIFCVLLTLNLLLVIKSFCLGFVSKVFFNFSRKTFFSWGSGIELIASNKRSCSLVRVLIFPSSSVDDSWSSCWIMLRFSSESMEDEVSSFEVSMSKLFICSSIAGSRLRFFNFFFNLQYLLMWPCFPQL